jgi:prepilin-type N-terminal cleavage/methylation domain-containing protein
MRRRVKQSGLTLLEMIVVSAVMAFALLGTLKAVTVTRGLSDRAEILTRLMLRAHSEIEARKVIPFGDLKVGTTLLSGFEDPHTTGVVTVSRLPDSAGVKIAAEMVCRTWRSADTIRLSALRFPEAKP